MNLGELDLKDGVFVLRGSSKELIHAFNDV